MTILPLSLSPPATLLFSLFFAGCKGLFQSEPEDPFKNKIGDIDSRPARFPDGKTIAYKHVPQDSAEPSPGSVPGQIWLINVMGQPVRTLVAGYQNEGWYRKVWDGRDRQGKHVASGVYLYRVVVKHDGGKEVFTDIRKMSLVR